MSEPPAPSPPSRRRFLTSFRDACTGLRSAFRSEPNLRIHTVATLIVLPTAIALRLSRLEIVLLVLTIGLVIFAELINTAVETTVDLACPERHPLAGRAKDIAAASVLWTAFVAVIVGVLLLGPPLWRLAIDLVSGRQI